MLDDETFDRMLFHARPNTPTRGSRLSEDQERLLRNITGDALELRPRPQLAQKRLLAYLPIAAVLLFAIVLASTALVVWPGTTSPAVAVTPKILPVQPIDKNSREQLMDLSHSIGSLGETRRSDLVRFQFWALEFSPDSPAKSVQPQEMTIRYLADGRKELETRALQARDSDGNPIDDPDAYSTHELVFRHMFGRDEPVGLFADPSGHTDWAALLSQGEGLGPDASSASYFTAVSNLLAQYRLSRDQEADLLRFLATLPGIRVDGQTTDRLGRSGLSFSASDGDSRRLLVISPEQGFLSYELIYTGSDRTDITPPAVIEYRAWY